MHMKLTMLAFECDIGGVWCVQRLCSKYEFSGQGEEQLEKIGLLEPNGTITFCKKIK